MDDHFWSNQGFLDMLEGAFTSIIGMYDDRNDIDLINKESLWASQFSLLYEFFKRHNIVPTYKTPFWLKFGSEISTYDSQEQL